MGREGGKDVPCGRGCGLGGWSDPAPAAAACRHPCQWCRPPPHCPGCCHAPPPPPGAVVVCLSVSMCECQRPTTLACVMCLSLPTSLSYSTSLPPTNQLTLRRLLAPALTTSRSPRRRKKEMRLRWRRMALKSWSGLCAAVSVDDMG